MMFNKCITVHAKMEKIGGRLEPSGQRDGEPLGCNAIGRKLSQALC